MKPFFDFLKYNNAVPFILFALILGAGTALATSPELRQSVFAPEVPVSTVTTVAKTDASRLLKENMKDFDLALRVEAITEDTASFYVSYSYRTLAVVDGTWQEVRKNGKMDISKQLLGKRDLKTYLADQIGQVMNREIVYLREAQVASRVQSAPKKSAKYAALVGQEIEKSDIPKEGVSGGVPTKEASKNAQEGVMAVETGTVSAETLLSKEEIREIIVAAVAEFLAIDTSMPDTGEELVTPLAVAPVPDEIPVAETPEEPVLEEDEPVAETPAP